MENTKTNLNEMNKLERYLKEHGIKYERTDMEGIEQFGMILGERHQIKVVDEDGNWIWDVICHYGSYGHEEGLLEYWSQKESDEGGDVSGYLTAEDVIQKIEGAA